MKVCKVCGCQEFFEVVDETWCRVDNLNMIEYLQRFKDYYPTKIECENCGTEYIVEEYRVEEDLPTKEEFENKIREMKLGRIMK